MEGSMLEAVAGLLGRVALAASEGHAEGHGGIDWALVVSLFTNVLLFFGFLFWKAAPAVSKGLADRRAHMAVDLERAQKKQAEAEQRLAEYQEKLDNLEREVGRVVDAYEREARADRVRIEQETEKALERLARETENTVQQEMRKAEKLLRSAAVEATLRAAEDKIRARIGEDDHRRLTARYIESLNGRGS